ncbi:DEAD/DEAH box helicase [Cyanobium sp. NIES-981]|uniref:DEAD/DEAH box helicase n=1 Tax=Cyanobium sp. NIES-981 TaxID=1851505 RepID=UPI0007DDCF97|nr:DEAD/DEAH box helicase [Cyanobium sp. NIES-981]SBO42673.1 Type III restriction enzyme, res subunit family [Cyanobium sp. NIES-981]
MPLDAVSSATTTRDSLVDYLIAAYPINDAALRRGFEELLRQPGTISQDPYLEGNQPYEAGKTLRELSDEGLLDQRMLQLFEADRPLYAHQEAAVVAAVKNHANIVVATGTGSGKTECFLIPMLQRLLQDPRPGMQALILYPMNALVNDQVKRLRKLLCKQDQGPNLIRFGFYTSRTEKTHGKAEEALRRELMGTDREELLSLFDESERKRIVGLPPVELVEQAATRVMRVQAISREEIWRTPPQILITNYSMLEHMLMRPKERGDIFESSKHFSMLILDEAHTYSGSTGTEVAMLLRRFKLSMGIDASGKIQAIATSASLGDPRQPGIKQKVCSFASQLFDEPFSEQHLVWGTRVSPDKRFGLTYEVDTCPDEELYEHYESLDVGSIYESVEAASKALKEFVPSVQIQTALKEAGDDVHVFLWHALAGHPHIRRLMKVLGNGPLPWTQVATSPELWSIPRSLDGDVEPKELPRVLKALSNLVQLVTSARLRPDEQPLVPVRLHLLYRSMEGLFACINPRCPGAPASDENTRNVMGYGRLYLDRRTHCESCEGPVLELSSCRKCGEVYSLAISKGNILAEVPRAIENIEENESILFLTPVPRQLLSSDEETGEEDEGDEEPTALEKLITLNGGYQLKPILIADDNSQWQVIETEARASKKERFLSADTFQLYRYVKPKAKPDAEGIDPSPNCCPGCGARRLRQNWMSRFTSFTDAPLSVVIDRLFDLLSETNHRPASTTDGESDKIEKPDSKILTFSDGRQDAAYFASDFQRSHTEFLYRQSIWKAFLRVATDESATITEVEEELRQLLRAASIPHPDRDPELHHKSYASNELNQHLRLNRAGKDLDKLAARRAREVLLCEFGLPSARRTSMEALGLVACHLDAIPDQLIDQTCSILGWDEEWSRKWAEVFLFGLTDEIRLLGAVDIQDASNYYSETGGDEAGRPGILGNRGQPRVFLKKAKLTNERDIISFQPRKNKDGQWSQVQNRIVRLVEKGLGHIPSGETMSELFDALVECGLLVIYPGQGYQLAWRQNSLSASKVDWYECPQCKQIFHKPGLRLLEVSRTPNAFLCPAHKCQGSLRERKNGNLVKQHYVSLIQRRPISLTAEEHTAQLQPEELSERENRFRSGEINLLSSSTTLELGVDIGELQVVALRNFPPFVSNYQQRAGRAGRRADGLAVTVMYGQRRPHDRYFFEQPRHLIAGSNKVPSLDIGNYAISKRHAQAELIGHFLRFSHQLGTEDLTVGEFLGLPDLDSQEPVEVESKQLSAYYAKLHLWLGGNEAKTYCKKILGLLGSENSEQEILIGLREEAERFADEQVADWNGQVRNYADVFSEWKEVRDRIDKQSAIKSDRLSKARSAIISELKKIRALKLHDVLAQASILPIYGFPIDVVQLLTQRNDTWVGGIGGHRLQRDRRMALTEYAPGQDVVVDDRVHRSVAVVRPIDLAMRYYWVCDQCNVFVNKSSQADIKKHLENQAGDLECRVCGAEVKEGKAGVGRAYVIPRSFSTNWSETPKITPFRKPLRQPTSQVFLAQEQSDQDLDLTAIKPSKFYKLVTSRSGVFFLSNQGPRGRSGSFATSGYRLCKFCGLDLSSQIKSKCGKNSRGKQPFQKMEHSNPITGKVCTGNPLLLHLAHQFRSDFLKLRFTEEANLPPLLGKFMNIESGNSVDSVSQDEEATDEVDPDGSSFWRSLTYALLAAASDVIDIDRSELDGLFRPVEHNVNAAEIVIYDNVASGAGHSKKIAEMFDDVLKRTLQLVSSCSCGASCYNCLRTYSNQSFHADLDRHLVRRYLEPIVGELSPDQFQRSFARHSSYFDVEKLPELLTQYVATARQGTAFALRDLKGFLSMSMLERAIDSHKENDQPVLCVLNALPVNEGNTASKFTRRKLADWIDSGYLDLYHNPDSSLEMFCLGHGSANAVAGQMLTLADREPRSIITRSQQGVGDAYLKIQSLAESSKQVSSSQLEDPGTRVFRFKPTSYSYGIDDLRTMMGLSDVLKDKVLASADYSDRYFENQRGHYALMLVELLDGPWLKKESQITIHTNQLREEFLGGNDLSRQEAIKLQLRDYPNFRLRWRNYNMPGPKLEHARTLKIVCADRSSYLVTFDKGLDFVKRTWGKNEFEVTEKTYVMIEPG